MHAPTKQWPYEHGLPLPSSHAPRSFIGSIAHVPPSHFGFAQGDASVAQSSTRWQGIAASIGASGAASVGPASSKGGERSAGRSHAEDEMSVSPRSHAG